MRPLPVSEGMGRRGKSSDERQVISDELEDRRQDAGDRRIPRILQH